MAPTKEHQRNQRGISHRADDPGAAVTAKACRATPPAAKTPVLKFPVEVSRLEIDPLQAHDPWATAVAVKDAVPASGSRVTECELHWFPARPTARHEQAAQRLAVEAAEADYKGVKKEKAALRIQAFFRTLIKPKAGETNAVIRIQSFFRAFIERRVLHEVPEGPGNDEVSVKAPDRVRRKAKHR